MSTNPSASAPRLTLVEPEKANFSVLEMHKSLKGLWAYVPQVSTRIREFATKYETERNGDDLAEIFERHFACPDKEVRKHVEEGFPYLKAFILVDRDTLQLHGHLLLQIETWGRKRVANILQYEVSKKVGETKDVLAQGFKDIEEFARQYGAQAMHLDCQTLGLERTFERFYGFNFKWIHLAKEL